MSDRPLLQRSGSNLYKQVGTESSSSRLIYYGEVITIKDETDGGRIKVRINGLDDNIGNDNLSWCYPELAKFFHVYPKVGEYVRITIENPKYPQRSRFWSGPIISQLHKAGFDSVYTGLSTTNMGLLKPEKAPSTFPNAKGVYPKITDIALLGRVNNDIILRENETYIRTGKHFHEDVLNLNTKNPAIFSQHYEENDNDRRSSTVVLSDKIALITHQGKPKFKATELTKEDRDRIFENGHPIARADILVAMLEKIRRAVVLHIHGYHGLPADKNLIITELEKLNFDEILQKNVVTN